MVTIQRLREAMRYDPNTGDFTWLVVQHQRTDLLGVVAGHKNRSTGYIEIRLDQRSYLAHRLAWFYMTGEWPECQIDHRDRNRANNRWTNLRAATLAEQARNKPRVRKSTGYRGVRLRYGKYEARIYANGVYLTIGRFLSEIEAACGYDAEARRLHGEFATLNFPNEVTA